VAAVVAVHLDVDLDRRVDDPLAQELDLGHGEDPVVVAVHDVGRTAQAVDDVCEID
jgi:hypothetical protein